MSISINSTNLLSFSLLSNLFSQRSGVPEQAGMVNATGGVKYKHSNYYYNEDGVPCFSKEMADQCIHGGTLGEVDFKA